MDEIPINFLQGTITDLPTRDKMEDSLLTLSERMTAEVHLETSAMLDHQSYWMTTARLVQRHIWQLGPSNGSGLADNMSTLIGWNRNRGEIATVRVATTN